MSAVVRARYRSKCPECGDLIHPNDNVYFIDDKPVHAVHEECLDSPGPWGLDPATDTLLRVLNKRGSLIRLAHEAGLRAEKLPLRIGEAFDRAMMADEDLRSLLADVASEYRGVA